MIMGTRFSLAFVMMMVFANSWAQLAPDFSADPRSGCAPIRVLFTDLSTGNPDRWQWDLGNGVISTSKDPSTTYFTPGIYTVKLTIYKGVDSAVITKPAFVTVYAIPQVSFAARPLTGCVPHVVQFSDSSTTASGTINSWTWDFGDGNLGNVANPVHTYTNAGTFKITLSVRSNEGCTNSFSIDNYIQVNPPLVADFDAVVPPSCKVPVIVSFSDKSVGNNIVGWDWDFGDGNTSTLANPTHSYTTGGSFDVRLIVRNAFGCTDTITRPSLISVGNLAASFNLGTGPFCINQLVPIQNTSTPAGQLDSTIWTFSDGVVLRQTDGVRTYTTPGNINFSMVVWKNGCSDTAFGSYNILNKPPATFTFSPAASCKVPLDVTFQNTTPNSTVISWAFGNSQGSTAQNPTTTYTQFGNFNVTMIVQHNNGCIDTVVQNAAIRIQAPTITSISGLPFDGCAPYSRTFVPTVSSSEPITSWQWNFGDGTTANIERPFKSFNVPGNYTVTLTITTGSGCTQTFTSNVKVAAKPVVAFSAAPLEVCPSDDVTFTDQSTGTITRWFWEFGDGGSSTTKSPTYQYNDTGWMDVRLIVFNENCGDTLLYNRYIYVRPPIAAFTDSSVCSNQLERFFTNNSIGATTWKWFFGDGDSSVVFNPVHVYGAPGSYTVNLKVADSLCKHETSVSIRILDEKANIEMESDGGCTANAYRFYARGPKTNPANISRYEWSINNGPTITTATNVLPQTFNDTATVQIQLIIYDLNGCSDTTIQSFAITSVGTIVNFGPLSQTVCVGNLVSFSDSTKYSSGNPIVRWEWNFGTGSDSIFTAGPFANIYAAAGVYDVRLTVVDSLGCRYTLNRPAAVTVHESVANFTASDTLVCLNSAITFNNASVGSAGSTAALKYKWDFGNGTIDSVINPVVIYPAEGTYNVQLSLVDSYGCSDTLLRPLYVTIANADANFSMSDSFSSCPPLQVSFTNSSVNNQTNFWDFGNGNNSNLVNPAHTYTQPGIFNVKLRVVGNGGCSDSLSKRVVIQGPSGVFSYGPLIGCPPVQVSFVSTTINTKFYTWDYSDGQSDVTTSAIANHAYQIPGTYIPRLILEDGLGCKLPIQGPDTIKVLGAKAFIQSLASYAYCDSATIQFTDSSVVTDAIVRYRWRFGDGTESALSNPSHTYTQPGRYVVTLEVWTANNCYTNDTLNVPIVIAPSPALDYLRDSTVCVPSMVQFTGSWNNPDTTVVTYRWDFGNGQTSTLIIPPPVSYNTPGLFNVSLMGTNNYGCSSTIMKPLNVFDTPRVVASPYAQVCLGDAATLVGSGALTYQWDPHPSLSCTNCASPSARPSGDYVYRVTGTDVNGCISSDTVLIRVKLPGSLSVGVGDTICVGESVQLRANGFELLTWTPSASLNNGRIPNPLARPTSTTRYVVTGTDSLNCFVDSGFIDVVVYPIPQFNISETLIKANFGSAVPLKTQSSADVSRWLWTPSSGLDCANCAEPLVTVTKKQIYTATVSNDGGCVAKDEVAVEPYCTADNVFIPNTFSPNGDGQNDLFYPRGGGVTSIKSMMIFTRWGELVYERKNFALNDVNAAWNGTYKGKPLTPDVYVYVVEVQCGNNEVFGLKGNVTLLR